jgi:hypothetical protein
VNINIDPLPIPIFPRFLIPGDGKLLPELLLLGPLLIHRQYKFLDFAEVLGFIDDSGYGSLVGLLVLGNGLYLVL